MVRTRSRQSSTTKSRNFGKSALPRTYAFIVDEAAAGDIRPCTNGVRAASYMLDITTETKPFPVSVWEVPVGNFCEKGGRFGPHQSAETVNGKINRFEGKIAWLAYFNAGVEGADLRIRTESKNWGITFRKRMRAPIRSRRDSPSRSRSEDVDIDHRGLAYASDRVGTGLFVLEYTGNRKRRK